MDTSYVIWRTPGAGFFSIITSTLARLHIAEEQGLTPVIDLETPASVYQEEHPISGTRNVWEYYFLQPAGRGVDELGKNPVRNDGTWPKGYGYDLSGSPIYKQMWDRYVQLNETTRTAIAQAQDGLNLSRTTLAVHYRGQEMRTAKGHHYPPTISQMNAAIGWALDNHDLDDILLVTEAQQYVDTFSRRWGKRLKPSPSFRLRHRNSYTVSPQPRPMHKYMLGLEALRDAHLMAQCGGLVCGRSNLSEAAIMLSDNALQPLIRISQGRNSFRPYIAPFKWYAKRAMPEFLGGFSPWAPPVGGAGTLMPQRQAQAWE
jgi:hypothetical protein